MTHRATPTIRLLDNRNARGSSGCAMSSQSWEISAVKTDRLGIFLKDDLEPNVAASLGQKLKSKNRQRIHSGILGASIPW